MRRARGDLQCDGQDADFTYFSVASFTVWDEVYRVVIDNRTGFLSCNCPDGTCRKKHAFLMDPAMVGGCKHQRLVLTTMRRLGCFGRKESDE